MLLCYVGFIAIFWNHLSQNINIVCFATVVLLSIQCLILYYSQLNLCETL